MEQNNNESRITLEEFQALQTQLLELKQQKYEMQERLQKQSAELVKSKEKAEKLEKDLNAKSTVSAFSMAGIMDRGKSKQDTAALVAENKNLTRLLAQNTKEHQEQQAALQENLKSIYESNEALLAELEVFKKREQECLRREEDLRAREEIINLKQAEFKAQEAELANRMQQAGELEILAKREELLRERELLLRDKERSIAEQEASVQAQLIAVDGATNGSIKTLEVPPSPLNNDGDPATPNEPPMRQNELPSYEERPPENGGSTADGREVVESGVGSFNEETKETERLSTEHVALKAKCGELEQLIQRLERQLSETGEEKENLKNQISILSNQMELWKQKSKARQAAITKLKEEKNALTESHSQELAHLSEQTKALAREITERLEGELARVRDELNLVQDDRRAMISKLSDKDLEVGSLRAQLSQQQVEAEQELKKLQAASQSERVEFSDALRGKAEIAAKLKEEMANKMAAIEEQCQKLTEELAATKSKLQAANKALQDSKALNASLKEAAKLAQSNLQRETSLKEAAQKEQKAVETAHADLQKTLSKLKDSETELRVLLHDKEATCNDLMAQLEASKEVALRQAEAHAQQMSQTASRSLATITKLELEVKVEREETGALHKQIEELNRKLEELKRLDEEKLSRMEEESESLKQQLEEENSRHLALQALHAEILAVNSRLEAELCDDRLNNQKELEILKEKEAVLQKVNEELSTQLSDAMKEKKIADRKSQQMIKELRSQIEKSKARAKATPSSAPSTPKGQTHQRSISTGGAEPASRRKSLDLHLPEQPSTNQLSTSAPSHLDTSAQKSHRPKETPVSLVLLQEENNTLSRRVAQLQQTKYNLEEKVQSLEEKVASLTADLERKQQLIQHHLSHLKAEGRSTVDMDRHRASRASKDGIMASLFRGRTNDLTNEVTAKMNALLEDTLLKNIQLKEDLETLGEEVTQLSQENQRLQEELAVVQSGNKKGE